MASLTTHRNIWHVNLDISLDFRIIDTIEHPLPVSRDKESSLMADVERADCMTTLRISQAPMISGSGKQRSKLDLEKPRRQSKREEGREIDQHNFFPPPNK